MSTIITGAHAIICGTDPDADPAILRHVFDFQMSMQEATG
jgi:hypothetical protein